MTLELAVVRRTGRTRDSTEIQNYPSSGIKSGIDNSVILGQPSRIYLSTKGGSSELPREWNAEQIGTLHGEMRNLGDGRSRSGPSERSICVN
jgi:hypothetical protein